MGIEPPQDDYYCEGCSLTNPVHCTFTKFIAETGVLHEKTAPENKTVERHNRIIIMKVRAMLQTLSGYIGRQKQLDV